MATTNQLGELSESVFEINMMVNMVRFRLDQMDCGEAAVDESIYVLRAADRLFDQLHARIEQLYTQ